MPPSRITLPLFASFLLPGPLPAEDRKPAATAEELGGQKGAFPGVFSIYGWYSRPVPRRPSIRSSLSNKLSVTPSA
jgi:hypothetical protein